MAVVTGQAYYKYELQKLLNAEIERIRDNMTKSFSPISDFSDYRHHIGLIEGLRRAVELCEEAESVINGAERG